VDNVVDAVLAARRDEAIGRAYNVDDDRITQHEYPSAWAVLAPAADGLYLPPAVRLGRATRRRRRSGRKRSPGRSRGSRSLQSAYDTARAKAELGWKPRVDFEEAIRRVHKGDR
jgi:nucleoside-diphosphate-sugar epimerase